MAAQVEIDEVSTWIEGGWVDPALAEGLVVAHSLVRSGYAAIDQANLDQTQCGLHPIDPGLHSYQKWQRWHVKDLGGSRAVRNLRFYSPVAPTANAEHRFNGHTLQAAYDGTKKLAAEFPDRTGTDTPNSVPTAPPASANIGIGGLLAGELRDVGVSDYVVSQVQTTAMAVSGIMLRNRYRYDDYA